MSTVKASETREAVAIATTASNSSRRSGVSISPSRLPVAEAFATGAADGSRCGGAGREAESDLVVSRVLTLSLITLLSNIFIKWLKDYFLWHAIHREVNLTATRT